MRRWPTIRRLWRSRRASAALEFALVAPLVIVLAAAITEFGNAFAVYDAVNKLSSQYASVWADCYDNPAGTCNTELSTYTSTASIGNVAPQISASALTLRMFQFTLSASGPVTVSVVYAYPAAATMTAAETTAAKTLALGASGVLVNASYTYTLKYFPAAMSAFLSSHLTASYLVVQLKS